MNKIIVVIVRGVEYNKTYKWNSADELKQAVANCDGLPSSGDIVIEAYIDDNLVDAGNSFDTTLKKILLVIGD